ncbi:outer membrane beta-barrel protein [Hellea balneolensis]|uniref:outer membrane beta-barrel protein n=1 Tax=Hellea balneolensis TaxID=287478 RepID=UPI00047CB59C|nr:outer membrane beta-barrel protein [Hellea balneolensis]
MTYLKFIIPAIVLTGCSAGPNFGTHYGDSASGGYGDGCGYSACPSPYSVGGSNSSMHQTYPETQPVSLPIEYSQAYQVQNGYVHQAPVHNAHPSEHYVQEHAQYQQPSAHAYGTQLESYSGPQNYYGSQGQVPRLRGAYGQPKRGYKYGTLGASMYDVDSDVYGIQGRLGYQSASLLGAEIEGFAGLTEEKETAGATTVKAGVDYTAGAFGVLRSHLSPKLAVHARGGYHLTDISGEVITGGVSTDVDLERQDGFAYGVGAEYSLSTRDFIRADYTRYDQDLGTNDSVSISYGRKF